MRRFSSTYPAPLALHALVLQDIFVRARFVHALFLIVLALVWPNAARAQNNWIVYDDALENGWQNSSWCAVDLASADTAHSGTRSIKATYTGAWQGLYLHNSGFDSSLYSSLTFWINGGAANGRNINVQALIGPNAQPGVPLNNYIAGGSVAANTWRQVTIPLSALHVDNSTNVTGFWLQDASGGAQPAFYLDDIAFVLSAPPSTVNLTVNTGQAVRLVDARVFGVNAAIWDNRFNTADTVALLTAMGNKILRFPGGSLSDEYHWQTNTTINNPTPWATNFDAFANVATQVGAQAFVTVNYGTGTAGEAAAWVTYANVTRHYGFRYWEIGNECYGGWETDSHAVAHDPFTYATLARDYIAQMKAADPTVKVGVVVITGEDSYANNTSHPATNPRTHQTHNGWTPVLLATLRSLGVTPDYIIYHRYEQNPGNESDALLLQSASSWRNDAADLRQQLTDYLGAAGASVELVVTENNSVSYNPGKQTTSLVNGLYLADSLANLLQTEFNALVWWDLRNEQDGAHNNSPLLYGWRQYGDYGITTSGSDRYPTYYVGKLLSRWAHGGDTVVTAASDYLLLAIYAAQRPDGMLSLLVINKSPSLTLNGSIALTGFVPQPSASVTFYGIPQDDAARTGIGSPDLAQTTLTGAAPTFSYAFPPYSATVLTLTPAAATRTVSGTVTLQGCVPAAIPQQSITFQFRPTDGSASFTQTVLLAANGAFTLSNVPAKAYNLAIKGAKWLQKVVPVDVSGGSVTGVDVTLPAGDVNNDNAVTTADYLLLKASFGATSSSSNWNNGVADLNCDGVVSTADYLLLKQNFGMHGDP